MGEENEILINYLNNSDDISQEKTQQLLDKVQGELSISLINNQDSLDTLFKALKTNRTITSITTAFEDDSNQDPNSTAESIITGLNINELANSLQHKPLSFGQLQAGINNCRLLKKLATYMSAA